MDRPGHWMDKSKGHLCFFSKHEASINVHFYGGEPVVLPTPHPAILGVGWTEIPQRTAMGACGCTHHEIDTGLCIDQVCSEYQERDDDERLAWWAMKSHDVQDPSTWPNVGYNDTCDPAETGLHGRRGRGSFDNRHDQSRVIRKNRQDQDPRSCLVMVRVTKAVRNQ